MDIKYNIIFIIIIIINSESKFSIEIQNMSEKEINSKLNVIQKEKGRSNISLRKKKNRTAILELDETLIGKKRKTNQKNAYNNINCHQCGAIKPVYLTLTCSDPNCRESYCLNCLKKIKKRGTRYFDVLESVNLEYKK
jgi:hypothetical protein